MEATHRDLRFTRDDVLGRFGSGTGNMVAFPIYVT
jgi:hypothetical protein